MMVNTCQKILIQVDDTLFCMKGGGFKLLVTVFILLQLLLLPVSAFDTAEMAREGLTIDRVMVQVGEDHHALVSVDYRLRGFTLFYVIIFGGKVIEPVLNGLITNAENIEVIEMRRDGADLSVKLTDSGAAIRLSCEVPEVIVRYPEGRRLELRDTSTIPL